MQRTKRDLNDTQKYRADKLREIISKLKNGEHVQNRMLKTWLSKDEYTAIDSDWNEQKTLREQLANKPDCVKQYEEKLKSALFAHNKAESYSNNGNNKTAMKFYNEAEKLFENALTYLQEIVAADTGLRIWFDRDTDWTAGGLNGADPTNVPRVVTSRSADKLGNGLGAAKLTKSEVKLQAVERALNDLLYEQVEVDSAKLKMLLKKIKQ